MSGPDAPSRPGLAFRVGITGHRPDKLAAFDPERLRGALARVLERIDAGVRGLARERSSAGRDDGAAPAPRLVSALAEGADRMAVEAAPASWALDALLPMPRAEYERDFLAPGHPASASLAAFRAALARADTIVELPALGPDLSRPGPRAEQYASLARALVRRIDLLVAIWDGEAAAGPGGTAHVVAEATAEGVPVVRVAPDGAAIDDATLDRVLDGILGVRAA